METSTTPDNHSDEELDEFRAEGEKGETPERLDQLEARGKQVGELLLTVSETLGKFMERHETQFKSLSNEIGQLQGQYGQDNLPREEGEVMQAKRREGLTALNTGGFKQSVEGDLNPDGLQLREAVVLRPRTANICSHSTEVNPGISKRHPRSEVEDPTLIYDYTLGNKIGPIDLTYLDEPLELPNDREPLQQDGTSFETIRPAPINWDAEEQYQGWDHRSRGFLTRGQAVTIIIGLPCQCHGKV